MEKRTPSQPAEIGARKKRQTGAARKNMFLLLCVAAISAAYVYFVHMPARETQQQLQRSLDAAEWELAEANTLPQRLAAAVEQRNRVREYIREWKDMAPSSSQAASFGAVVAQLVHNAGAQTDRLSPQGEIPFEYLGQVPISFEFDGEFFQIFAVLSMLESREESIWIDEVLLEKSDDSRNRRLHCLIKLAVFTDKSKVSD